MEKLKSKIGLLFLAALTFMLVAGCSGFTGDVTVKTSDKCVLSISVDGYENLSSKSAQRTILPDDYASGHAFQKITLQGKSSRGEVLAETEITFTAGKGSIDLAYDVWELTLTAYDSFDGTVVPVLQGRAYVDLSKGGSEVQFTLKTDSLTTPGAVEVNANYTDTNKLVSRYVIGIYDFLTGEAVGTPVSEDIASPDTTGTAELLIASVAPGTYTLKVELYRKLIDDTYKVIGTYSEIIVVAPGRTTTKTFTIPDIIMKKPAAPEGLTAELVKDSEKDGKYNVLVKWQDKSVNEENFVLTIKSYADKDDTTGTVYKILGAETDLGADKEKFFESDMYVSGSLMNSSETCVIKLPTGKLFDISIQAQNFVGESEECVRETTGTPETGNTLFGTEKINRVMFVYNLDGGVLKTDASTAYTGQSLVEYDIYKGVDLSLKEIEAHDSGNYPTLIKNNHPFTKWVYSESSKPTPALGVTTTDFNNVYVKASYNQTYIISYSIPGFEDLDETLVSAVYGAGNTDCKNGSVIATGNPDITFKVDSTDYDQIKVKIDGTEKGMDNGGANTVVISAKDIATGTHTIEVIAHRSSDDQWYSTVFAITIER